MKPLPLEFLLTKTRKALVLIDVQNEFCHPDGAFGRKGCDLSTIEGMMAALKRLVESAREKGIPVVFIQNVEDSKFPKQGSTVDENGVLYRKASFLLKYLRYAP